MTTENFPTTPTGEPALIILGSESNLRIGDSIWVIGDRDLDQSSAITSIRDLGEESHRSDSTNFTGDSVIDQGLWMQLLVVQFGVRLRELDKPLSVAIEDAEFAEYVRHSIEQHGPDAIAAWKRAIEIEAGKRQSIPDPTPTTHEIDSWFSGLEEDAEETGNPMPTTPLIEEAKRIVGGLNRDLLEECDVYTLEQGKIAVEIFGQHGHAFLLICEPDGGALCTIAEPGYSRQARYDNSKSLPDNFLKDGLISTRGYNWSGARYDAEQGG